MRIFVLFFVFLHIFCMALEKYTANIIINFSLDGFYTGRIDNKLFLARNLFSDNNIVLVPNIYDFSEGIYINKISDSEYFLISNTNGFGSVYSMLVTFFSKDFVVMESNIFSTYYSYNILKVYENYEQSDREFFLIGLINNFFDFDIVLSKYDLKNVENSIRLGTNFVDYPIYFSENETKKFRGYILLSILEKNNYRDFNDLKLTMDTKRFNSDSILVCFFNSNMKIEKYFVLRFPNNVVDYSIIQKSMDSVLLRVDFIDRISGYYITNNFVHIDFDNVYVVDHKYSGFDRFYVDNFVNLRFNPINFSKSRVNLVFNRVILRKR
ncbi:MAG: hypothetical protein RMJ36_05165 [Candidatus Calescibacterium sp.]|nr:hypothetical protein [Candidatus Calescibacterium sp.]MDW8133025.1 hypothetical protein [Candidatus Calescibacterium sp.]